MPNVDCGYYASAHDFSESGLNELSCARPNKILEIITILWNKYIHFQSVALFWSQFKCESGVLRMHFRFLQLSRKIQLIWSESSNLSNRGSDGNIRFRSRQIGSIILFNVSDKTLVHPKTTINTTSFRRFEAAKKTQHTGEASHNYIQKFTHSILSHSMCAKKCHSFLSAWQYLHEFYCIFGDAVLLVFKWFGVASLCWWWCHHTVLRALSRRKLLVVYFRFGRWCCFR